MASLAFAPVLLFFLAALWRWPRAPEAAGWILLPIAYYTLLHAVFLGSIRYRLSFEPFIILVAAWGLSNLRSQKRIDSSHPS